MSQEKGWREAILKVLQEAEEPLHYAEITRKIGEDGLRSLTGATPQDTVAGNLSRLRQEQRVVRTGSGNWALPETAEQTAAEEAAEEEEAVAATGDPSKFTVKAYGLYWDRSLVEWSQARGQLWGQQDDNAMPVNFADQDGVYLLHSWNEIVYVGQTFTRKGESGLYDRLRDHHTDKKNRKTDRWDSFSWFGFRPVAGNGELLDAPSNGDLASVFDVIESMFIEALMPRLNMQTGRGSKVLRETGLYFQSSFQRVSRGFR